MDIIGIPAGQSCLQAVAASLQVPCTAPLHQELQTDRPQPNQQPRTQQLKSEAGCCQEPCSSATASNGLNTRHDAGSCSHSVPGPLAQCAEAAYIPDHTIGQVSDHVSGHMSGKTLGTEQDRSRSLSAPCSADIANAFELAGGLACDLQPSESTQPDTLHHPAGQSLLLLLLLLLLPFAVLTFL